MEHIYGPARALVETYIIPNLYTVELWIGVLVVAISVVMSYVRYSNAPETPRVSDEGRIQTRRNRGESFVGVWSDENTPLKVYTKGGSVEVEGLVPHSVPMSVTCTYSVVGKDKKETRNAPKCILSLTVAADKKIKSGKAGTTVEFSNDLVLVSLLLAPSSTSVCVSANVRLKTPNKGKKIILHSIEYKFSFGSGASFASLQNVLMYQNGFQSWAPTGPIQTTSKQQYAMFNLPYLNRFISSMMHNVDSPVWGKSDVLISEHFSAFQHSDSDIAFVSGFLSSNIALGSIYFKRGERAVSCLLDYNGRAVTDKNGLGMESLVLMKGQTTGVFEKYARLCVEQSERKMPVLDTRSPVGWCSWYELYGDVKESDILRNVELLASHPELGVEYVQLDDGYQAAIGDWLSCNRKFPHGLKAVAKHIQAHGFKAGIWVAPFLAGHSSTIYKRHPDWLIKNSSGKGMVFHFNPNWHEDSYTYAIDLTHPEVQEWLKTTFETLREFGFSYFKLDYLIAGIRDGVRHNDDLSRCEAYRKGLEIIRKAVGPDGFILGCGAPLAPSLGYVDAMRVSNDVADRWGPNALESIFAKGEGVPCTQLALLSNCSRNFLHGIWWLNDPDCIIARSRNTGLTVDEVTTQVTLFGMTGGLIVLSDDLTNMSMDRLALAQRIMPPSSSVRGAALEPMRDRYPRTFVCKAEESGDSSLIAFINWSAYKVSRAMGKEFHLILEQKRAGAPWTSSHYLFDFWGQTLLEDSRVTIAPHGVCATIATEQSLFPALVGNSFTLLGMSDGRLSGKYDESTRRLVIRGHHISVLNGLLWVVLPHRNNCGVDYANTSPKCSATIVENVETPEHTIMKVSVSLAGRGSWQLSIAVAKPGETVDLPSRPPSPRKRRESVGQYSFPANERERSGSTTSPRKS